MNKSNKCEKLNCILFWSIILLAFVSIYVFNYLTPYMSDDFEFTLHPRNSIGDIISTAWGKYNTWNGRLVPQTFMVFGLSISKSSFNLINSLCYIAVILLIYSNIVGRRRYDRRVLLITTVALWLFVVDPGQTLLWVSGACNYLWAMVVILGFITVIRVLSDSKSLSDKPLTLKTIIAIATFILGLLAGWCNENTSGGAFIIALYYIISRAVIKGREAAKGGGAESVTIVSVIKSIPAWAYTGIIGLLTGLYMLVSSPGAKLRLAENLSDEGQTGIAAYVGRLLKLNNYVREDFSIIGILIIFLLVYTTKHIIDDRRSGAEASDSFVRLLGACDAGAYILASVAVVYVLIFTTTPMNRALFGAGIFLISALVQLLVGIGEDDRLPDVLCTSLIIIGCICYLYQFMNDGVNLVRIRREINEREEFVATQVEEGKTIITLPMVREEWNNRFTFIYHNDITEDMDGWGNMIYEVLYDVDEIVGVTYDEWDEMQDE